MDIKSEILSYIRKNGASSHADLAQLFTKLQFEFKGDFSDVSADNPHIIFWKGWNEAALTPLLELVNEGVLVRRPANQVEKLLMGQAFIPVVTRNYPYKTDHWMPVVFEIANE